MKNYLVSAIFLIVILLVVSYIVSSSNEVSTVISEDGKLTLTVAESALPEGVEVSDITITEESLPDDIATFDDGTATVLARYQLSPEGVVFNEPVEVTYQGQVTDAGAGYPLIIHDHGGQFTILTDINYGMADDDTYQMTFALSGFSGLEIAINAFSAQVSPHGGQYFIGGIPVPLAIDIYRPRQPGVYSGHRDTIRFIDRGNPFFGELVSDEWKVLPWSFAFDEHGSILDRNKLEYGESAINTRDGRVEVGESLYCVDEGYTQGGPRNLFVEASFTSNQQIPKMDKYIVSSAEGIFTYTYQVPIRDFHSVGIFCNKPKEGEMIQIEPPKTIFQAGTAPLGQNEAETGYLHEGGVKMFDGKPVDAQHSVIDDVR